MKIFLGADSYGFDLKQAVKNYLLNQLFDVEDLGIKDSNEQTPYYETASKVARRVADHSGNRGILICGTGMGMAIIANKHPGVYAAVCENVEAARRSRSINNSNILTLGGLVTKPQIAQEILDIWLNTKFTEGWDSSIQDWLHNSMEDIAQIETEKFRNMDEI
ncbi:MAG TPA: RpiB/LacA/LacB family sugar-phosphate isomerase [Cyanothece sp. UBA12306]|nr:RpiB/LacA/LacB family sugar-phosphate isomerase [Cyanothece sp. UBA12306]